MTHRVWRLGADIDTDALAPGHAMKHGMDVIARHCLEAVRPDFAAGVRPGDLELAADGVAGRVVVVEPTGAETELVVDVGGERLIVVMHGRTAVKPDDTVHLQVDPAKVHVFDAADGRRLG